MRHDTTADLIGLTQVTGNGREGLQVPGSSILNGLCPMNLDCIDETGFFR